MKRPSWIEHRDPVHPPPNLRLADSNTQCCATCLMFDMGFCWGYGNTEVQPDWVCDSYAPDTDEGRAKVLDTHEARQALYAEQVRAKYTQAEVDDLGAKGHALKDDDGEHYSYPIADEEDLHNAIHAVGRGNADHDKIRKFIIGRAHDLGATDAIPDNWNDDGSLKPDADSAELEAEEREGIEFPVDGVEREAELREPMPNGVAEMGNPCPTCGMVGGNGIITNDAGHGGLPCPTCTSPDATDAETDGGAASEGSPDAETASADNDAMAALGRAAIGARLGRTPKRKGRQRSGPPLGREFRQITAHGLEVREGPGNTLQLRGLFLRYGVPYQVNDFFGAFTETMYPGVLKQPLAQRQDVRFLVNHDGLPFGRTAKGTLDIEDSPEGGACVVTLDGRRQDARDLAYTVERGDVDQMSCGFIINDDEWGGPEDEWGLPTERSVYGFEELFDVSAVTFPASPTTSIELAYRALNAMPVESRARVRKLWAVSRELREGKVLSAENAEMLQQALEALHEADDVDIPAIVTHLQTIDHAVDRGQAGIAAVLHKANPDGDASDLEPELASDDDGDADANEDGTSSGGGGAPNPAEADDGTGSRSLELLELEAEALRLQGRKRRHMAA